MSINQENLEKWLTALRSGDFEQVDGTLAKKDGDTMQYCCLGVGCMVAGVPFEETRHCDGRCEGSDECRDDCGTEYYFGRSDAQDLPPAEFHEWLGFADALDRDACDVPLDWPEEYESLTEPNTRKYLVEARMTCSALNDTFGLTFPQIADMIAYFGLKERVE